MNARPSRARAAARPSLGSLASTCTLPARSPSRAAWASADGMGGGSPRGARQGRWRLLWRPVAPPLALRQHRVGVGLLLQHEPAVLPALGAAADPVEDPQLVQPLQGCRHGADADAGLGGDRRVGWIQAAGAADRALIWRAQWPQRCHLTARFAYREDRGRDVPGNRQRNRQAAPFAKSKRLP